MNIAITSASGNIGKSTICLNLGLALDEEFENIRMFDCDERMETLKEVMEIRAKNNLKFLQVSSKIEDIEKSLNNKATLNIYDLKGHLGQKEALIMGKSDLVIVITSNEDLVLKKSFKFVQDLKANNINYLVLINKFNDKLIDFETINKMFDNKVFNSYLKDKISYKRIDIDGSLFYDKKDLMVGLKPTKLEFENFTNEFIEVLEKLYK